MVAYPHNLWQVFNRICRGTIYYLLSNALVNDRRYEGGTVLTAHAPASLSEHDGALVVFGKACRLGAARIKREGVTFRQILC